MNTENKSKRDVVGGKVQKNFFLNRTLVKVRNGEEHFFFFERG
jgi:hypothetical protein